MKLQPHEINEDAVNISSKQKGAISENRISEIITLSSAGRLTCYTPNSDDDGIDLVVNPKGKIAPLFIQIKSRFVLQKSGRYIHNVGKNTFVADRCFYLLFVYFNKVTIEVDNLWLVPSSDFAKLAYDKAEGSSYKSFYRINAGPKSKNDRWAKYSVAKAELGNSISTIISQIYL
jgi:hypothetical protein